VLTHAARFRTVSFAVLARRAKHESTRVRLARDADGLTILHLAHGVGLAVGEVAGILVRRADRPVVDDFAVRACGAAHGRAGIGLGLSRHAGADVGRVVKHRAGDAEQEHTAAVADATAVGPATLRITIIGWVIDAAAGSRTRERRDATAERRLALSGCANGLTALHFAHRARRTIGEVARILVRRADGSVADDFTVRARCAAYGGTRIGLGLFRHAGADVGRLVEDGAGDTEHERAATIAQAAAVGSAALGVAVVRRIVDTGARTRTFDTGEATAELRFARGLAGRAHGVATHHLTGGIGRAEHERAGVDGRPSGPRAVAARTPQTLGKGARSFVS